MAAHDLLEILVELRTEHRQLIPLAMLAGVADPALQPALLNIGITSSRKLTGVPARGALLDGTDTD